MRPSLVTLLTMLALSTSMVAQSGHCWLCSRQRSQLCEPFQNAGTCYPCTVINNVSVNGKGECLDQCTQAGSLGPNAALQNTQARCAQSPKTAAVSTEPEHQPWLDDTSLQNELATYSASFARIIKAHQSLYTVEKRQDIPTHGTGTFFTTDDDNEVAGTFEFLRKGNHWLYKIDKPYDNEMKLPNELDLTSSTWTLFRHDGSQRIKVASGTISSAQ